MSQERKCNMCPKSKKESEVGQLKENDEITSQQTLRMEGQVQEYIDQMTGTTKPQRMRERMRRK